MADAKRYLRRAADAKRESKHVEFKEEFDPTNDGNWLELLKDLAAIANVGGGGNCRRRPQRWPGVRPTTFSLSWHSTGRSFATSLLGISGRISTTSRSRR
jgi:hypothetical protein